MALLPHNPATESILLPSSRR